MSQIQAADPDARPLSSVPDTELSSVVGRTPWQLFWMRFKRDHVAVGAGVVVVILIALALSAPFFAHSVIHRGPLDINQDLTSDIGIPLVVRARWRGSGSTGSAATSSYGVSMGPACRSSCRSSARRCRC